MTDHRPDLADCGCGGTAMWNPVERKPGDYVEDLGYVDCTNCGIRTEGRTAKAVAYQAWNRAFMKTDTSE